MSCNLCRNRECKTCSSYTGICFSCISNAISDGLGGCKCDSNYYWSVPTINCDLCDDKCVECQGNGWYECVACETEMTLVGSLCLYGCPSGFTTTGCSSVSSAVLSEEFDMDLDTDMGLFNLKGDAARINFFKTLDSYDSTLPSEKGVYLSQNIYLSSKSQFFLSHSMSAGIWYLKITNGPLLLFSTGD